MALLREDFDVESIITSEPMDAAQLQKRLKEWADKDYLAYFWTPTEIQLLKHYSPHAYQSAVDADLTDSGRLLRRVIFQYQSEIVNRSSVIDAGILAGKRNIETVRHQILNLDRLNGLAAILETEYEDIYLADLAQETLDDKLIEAKLAYATLLGTMPNWLDEVPTVTKSAPDLGVARDTQFSYIDEVLGKIGPRVVAIVLYGSASRETNPDNVKDRDNYLVVQDGTLPEIYQILQGHRFQPSKDGKPVGFNLIEQRSFARFLRMNHDANESLEHCKVLYGEAEFPVVSENEIQQRGTSYAVLRSKILKSSAAWQMVTPRWLIGIPEMFDYLQKTPLFMIQAGLNLTEGVQSRNKGDFREVYAELGGNVADHREDVGYITECVCRAAAVSPLIAERFFKGMEFKDVPINLKATPISPDGNLVGYSNALSLMFLGYH